MHKYAKRVQLLFPAVLQSNIYDNAVQYLCFQQPISMILELNIYAIGKGSLREQNKTAGFFTRK